MADNGLAEPVRGQPSNETLAASFERVGESPEARADEARRLGLSPIQYSQRRSNWIKRGKSFDGLTPRPSVSRAVNAAKAAEGGRGGSGAGGGGTSAGVVNQATPPAAALAAVAELIVTMGARLIAAKIGVPREQRDEVCALTKEEKATIEDMAPLGVAYFGSIINKSPAGGAIAFGLVVGGTLCLKVPDMTAAVRATKASSRPTPPRLVNAPAPMRAAVSSLPPDSSTPSPDSAPPLAAAPESVGTSA